MICLTADIHHSSLNSPEQRFSELSEAELANKFIEICSNHNLKTTLFITGRTFLYEWEHLKPITKYNGIEFGGHTFKALRPQKLHDYFRRFLGSYYGPYLYQWWDIRRTKNTIRKYLNTDIYSWRTHAYASDSVTNKTLPKFGIKIISDEVNKLELRPRRITQDLISFPINVLPDHEHIYHGDRTVEHVQEEIESGWRDSFTEKSFSIDEWFEIVAEQIEKIEKQGGIATILAHPICMYVTDKFQIFAKLCKFISKYKCLTLSEALKVIDEDSFRSQ